MLYQIVFATLAILTAAGARIHEEPECSKYHFEEKVLEKLVRLEHQMIVWNDKMEGQISEVNKAENARTDDHNKLKDSIQQELEAQKTKLDEVLSNFQQQAVRLSKDLMEKQGDINTTLLAFIKRQETEVKNIKADLTTPTVVFKARELANKNPVIGTLMRYTQTVTNVGGGYDTSTGYFTAPHAGTYLFTVQICTAKAKQIYVQIIAADIIIGLTVNADASYYPCNTGTGVAVLAKGDKVWIKCTYRGGNDAVYADGHRWNSFSGVLIHTNTN